MQTADPTLFRSTRLLGQPFELGASAKLLRAVSSVSANPAPMIWMKRHSLRPSAPTPKLDGTRVIGQRLTLMSFARRLAFITALSLSCGLLTGRAEEKSFTASLPEVKQQAAGIDHLKPEQIATLNNLVQREILLARQGNVRAFAAEFSQRRSAPERAKAGIDKLTSAQRVQLDAEVAQAIANQTPLAPVGLLSPVQSEVTVQAVGPHPEIHGSVSFVAGTSGGGRNFYGGSFEVEEYDPVHHLGIAFSYSELHGKGLWWPYGYGYRNSPLYLHGGY